MIKGNSSDGTYFKWVDWKRQWSDSEHLDQGHNRDEQRHGN